MLGYILVFIFSVLLNVCLGCPPTGSNERTAQVSDSQMLEFEKSLESGKYNIWARKVSGYRHDTQENLQEEDDEDGIGDDEKESISDLLNPDNYPPLIYPPSIAPLGLPPPGMHLAAQSLNFPPNNMPPNFHLPDTNSQSGGPPPGLLNPGLLGGEYPNPNFIPIAGFPSVGDKLPIESEENERTK